MNNADAPAGSPALPLAAQTQAQLVREPVFRAFFITQFTGAFSDNFYKSALLMMFTFGGVSLGGADVNVLNNLVAALLIMPFLIFAPWMGQWADRMPYDRLIRAIKLAEVIIILGAIAAVALQSALGLLLVVLLTGIQSACFSPLKQSILPVMVIPSLLTGVNGLIQAGTSAAIFTGLIAGSLIIQLPAGPYWVGIGALLLAGWGWWNSRKIPPIVSANPAMLPAWNPLRQMWAGLSLARQQRYVVGLILGISWYWFLGSLYLTQIPNLARSVLHAEGSVVSLMLTIFLLGVCGGGVLAGQLGRKLSRSAAVLEAGVDPRLVSVAGLAIFIASLVMVTGCYLVDAEPEPVMRSLSELVNDLAVWVVWLAIFLLGASGGLFMVPLSALLQHCSPQTVRARIMGTNNMINALFMLAAALLAMLVLGVVGLSIPQLFGIVSLLHLLFMAVLLWRMPLFIRR